MSHSVDRLAQLQRMVFFFCPPAKEDIFAKVRILQIIILTLNPCTNYPDIFSALRSAAGLAPDRFFLLCLDPTAPIPCPGFQFNANARLHPLGFSLFFLSRLSWSVLKFHQELFCCPVCFETPPPVRGARWA